MTGEGFSVSLLFMYLRYLNKVGPCGRIPPHLELFTFIFIHRDIEKYCDQLLMLFRLVILS